MAINIAVPAGSASLSGKTPNILYNVVDDPSISEQAISEFGMFVPTILGTNSVQIAGHEPTLSSGTISQFNIFQTVLSQYANSPILLQLIQNFYDYVDQTANMDAFYNLIWNVDTAVGPGLDIWGRIVGVNRVLTVQIGAYLGFEGPVTASGDPFNQSPFYTGSQLTQNVALTDAAYRTLIYAKALTNISDGSCKSINQILINLFGASGNAYVVDNNNMTMVYYFTFVPTAVQQAIIQQSGVLPKPAGVAVSFTFV